MFVFGWLRERAKLAFLAGVGDAIDTLIAPDDTSETQVRALRLRLLPVETAAASEEKPAVKGRAK